jgi:neural Wiskott-Aldrich syndrome protein
MVSPPATGTFVHLGHVGFNSRGQIETSNDIEPGWPMMLEELQGSYGTTKSQMSGDREFVQGFIAGTKVGPLIAAEAPADPVIPLRKHLISSRSKNSFHMVGV